MDVSAINSTDNNYLIWGLQNDALTPVTSTARISEIETEANREGVSTVDVSIDDNNNGYITSEELDSYFEYAQNFVSNTRGEQSARAANYNEFTYFNAAKTYGSADAAYNMPQTSTFSIKV